MWFPVRPLIRSALAFIFFGVVACVDAERAPESTLPAPPESRQFEDRAALIGLSTLAWSRAGWGDPADPYTQPCGRSLYSAGGVVAVDLTSDDRIDVFVPRLDGPDYLFVQQTDGTFIDEAESRGVASQSPSGGALAVDLTGDGALDLYVTSPGRADHRLFVARADGTFVDEAEARGVSLPRASADTCGQGFGAAAGDVDADGDLDLMVVAWRDSPRSALLINEGGGVFADRTEAWGLTETSSLAGFSPVLADLDDDGRVDLLFVGDFEDTRMYWNAGARFEDDTDLAGFGGVQDGMGVDLGDIDGDGDLDVFITAICEPIFDDCQGPFGFNGNHLLIQQGKRRFNDEAAPRGVLDGRWGWGTAFWDVNEDGFIDLGMTNGYAFLPEYLTDEGRLWLNDGGGTFIRVADAVGAREDGQGRGYVPVDLDADGDLDLLVTDHDGSLRAFIRPGVPERRWLTVRLENQRGPNQAGIGAVIRARAHTTDGQVGWWVRRDVLAFDRYQGHGPAAVQFYSPDAERFELQVEWPDRTVTEHDALPDRAIVLQRSD